MTARWFVAAALLVGLAATAPNADETSARVFHIGIVAGTPRSSPERVAFEDRLRELGYVEGRNLAIDFVQYTNLDRGAAAVGEMARRHVDVLLIGGQAELIKAAVTTARSVPVVTTAVDSDPLAKGHIASLSHPGGNLTDGRRTDPR
jgi:putative ABC transport system substrate-binding protein